MLSLLDIDYIGGQIENWAPELFSSPDIPFNGSVTM